MAFELPVRVYWEDTDAGGIVFYANYLKYFERARTEWLRALGIEQQKLREQTGGFFVVTHAAVDYVAPARLDDQLSVSVALLECRGASFVLAQRIERNGALLVEATVKIASLCASTFRPSPIPGFLLSQLHLLPEAS